MATATKSPPDMNPGTLVKVPQTAQVASTASAGQTAAQPAPNRPTEPAKPSAVVAVKPDREPLFGESCYYWMQQGGMLFVSMGFVCFPGTPGCWDILEQKFRPASQIKHTNVPFSDVPKSGFWTWAKTEYLEKADNYQMAKGRTSEAKVIQGPFHKDGTPRKAI